MTHRQEKVAGRLQEIISTFLNLEANTKSVVTVTHCDIGSDLKNVVAFLSVFPESYEEEALAFAKRKRTDLRQLIAREMPMKTIPFIDFEIDAGEKNRQKIEGILGRI
ncbi:MAG: ribosome-binding factor A [Candidatus Paceibacterota bacterium]|jgi:ribosome-binding factor A